MQNTGQSVSTVFEQFMIRRSRSRKVTVLLVPIEGDVSVTVVNNTSLHHSYLAPFSSYRAVLANTRIAFVYTCMQTTPKYT